MVIGKCLDLRFYELLLAGLETGNPVVCSHTGPTAARSALVDH